MRRSKSEIYLHLVWATRERQPLITPTIQERLYPFLEMQAKHLECHVLAMGGMPDHIHLVVRTPTAVCVAQLMKLAKGSSSAFVNDLTNRTPYFRWLEGYGVFSLCRPLLGKIIRYKNGIIPKAQCGLIGKRQTRKCLKTNLHFLRPQDASPSE